MKKINFLLLIALMMLSCSGKSKDKAADTMTLKNTADSVNYAIGYVSASQIVQYELKTTPTEQDAQDMVDGIMKGYELDEKQMIARSLASAVLGGKEQGMNGMFSINSPILLQGLLHGITGNGMIDEDVAMGYFQQAIYSMQSDTAKQNFTFKDGKFPTKVETVILKDKNDSLNYIYGMLSGKRLNEDKKFSEEDIKLLSKTYNERMAEKHHNDQLVAEGEQMGSMMKLYWTDGVMGDKELAINLKAFTIGIKHGLLGKTDGIFKNSDEAQLYLNKISKAIQEKKNAELAKDQLAYLEENKKKEGVFVTESGLQYQILRQAEGAKPDANSTVEVHYEGRLIDGTVFDSSYKHGETISFPLQNVIKGWTEGLQLMSVGAKYRLFIPYQLGYGEHGAHTIPPFATLIFDVELISIK